MVISWVAREGLERERVWVEMEMEREVREEEKEREEARVVAEAANRTPTSAGVSPAPGSEREGYFDEGRAGAVRVVLPQAGSGKVVCMHVCEELGMLCVLRDVGYAHFDFEGLRACSFADSST